MPPRAVSVRPAPPAPQRRRRAFTLIELLTVMAIIGILAAILIPTVAGANNSAKKAKTKVMFAQWATAIEGFRQEYGYYPDFRTNSGDDLLFGNGIIDSTADSTKFVQALTGRRLDGTALQSGDPGLAAGNTKGINFCSFSSGELTAEPRVQDAFGNNQVAILYDKNFDGQIRTKTTTGAEYTTSAPSVQTIGGTTVTTPLPDGTVLRASLAIYSAGSGDSAVASW